MMHLALTPSQDCTVRMINQYGSCDAGVCSQREWAELVAACYCWRDGSMYRAHEVYGVPDFEMCEPDAKGWSSAQAEEAFESSARYIYLLESGFLQK